MRGEERHLPYFGWTLFRNLDIDTLLRKLLELSPSPAALLDAELRVIWANDAMAQLLDTTQDELLGGVEQRLTDAALAPPLPAQVFESHYATGFMPRQMLGTAPVGGEPQRIYELEALKIESGDQDATIFGIIANDVTERELAVFGLDVSQQIAKLGNWRWDSNTNAVYCSKQMLAMVGRDPALGPFSSAEVVGRAASEADAETLKEFVDAAMSADEGISCEVQVYAADDELRWFRFKSVPDPTRSGSVFGTTQDITEERERLAEATVAQERFRHAFEDGDVAMAMTALDGRILIANSAILRMLGYSREELEHLSMNELLLSDDQKVREQIIAEAVSGERDSFVVESHILRGDGVFMWVIRHITVLRDSDGTVRELLTQLVDATEHHRTVEQLRHLADHDPLTDVLNRRGFDAILANHTDQERRSRPDACLMEIDINNFKSVNDLFGHAAGDQILVSLADILRERLRSTDFIGRLGGDEFAVLLPETHEHGALKVAEQIAADAAARLVIPTADGTHEVCVSIGIACLKCSEHAGLSLSEAADRAMYQAKTGYGTRIVAFAGDET